ncbi:MAG: glutamine--fructose-6-phosphate transaminase (isomerizing) [Candidatus Obscuribacterales bacterium]|jgi:glucosamine--fructose-6-phosphate aminotransferase (isomerizing)|nr:glutamine--fructose-6-phosphate transaminase (isomerizing) [Candidatus Obscuribacterales bacterium]
MCGIVGYLGHALAAPVLLSELRCLEYRGYDSAGVAVIQDGQLAVMKAAGKLSNLEKLLDTENPRATVGIGHTRWATHGVPNDENAHPHTDCSSTLAIVHNGIIENYQELRAELTACGHKFCSETDTEVVSHLIEDELKKSPDLLTAIRGAVGRLRGAYALGIVSQNHPDKIYAVNHHYSLAVGLGENESFLASDSIAVCQHTNRVLRLEQSEIAEITQKGARLFSFAGEEVKRNPVSMDNVQFVTDKQGHKHFLMKEIHEQPLVLRQTIGKYLLDPRNPVDFSPSKKEAGVGAGLSYGVTLTDAEIARIDRIKVVACGTAYHAGMVGKYLIEEVCGISVDVETASEARSRRMLVDDRTLTIAVSQSGETADTLAAIGEAAGLGSLVMGITNRPDSHLALVCPHLIVTECGIEVSVAATKTFTAQVACFYLLALYLAERKGILPAEKLMEYKAELLRTPALIERILSHEDDIRLKSVRYAETQDVMFMGRGVHFPVALEGALKLKELSYIHASGYAAGELKHGPIAVLDSKVPVVTLLIPGSVYEKTISNAQEVKARRAQMIGVAVEGDELAEKTFETVFWIPPISEFFSPLISVVPLQLMSYFIADYLGKDVDQPRNLAKSVTVE